MWIPYGLVPRRMVISMVNSTDAVGHWSRMLRQDPHRPSKKLCVKYEEPYGVREWLEGTGTRGEWLQAFVQAFGEQKRKAMGGGGGWLRLRLWGQG